MTDHNEQNTAQSIDEIRADRACIGCGFNLYAQPVTKEEHYGLAVCRCPECGTVAALQSYPVMTHWVNRFRALMAAVWIVLLLGVFFGNTMAFMGLTKGACNLAGQELAGQIGLAHHIWEEEKLSAQPAAPTTQTTPVVPGLPAGTAIVTTNGVTTINGIVVSGANTTTTSGSVSPSQYRWTVLDQQWYKDHLDETVEGAGGLWSNLDREFLVMLIPGTIVALLFGVFWSIALMATGRRWVVLVPLVACGIALSIVIAISMTDDSWIYGSQAAEKLYTPVIAPVYLWCLFLIACTGVWVGRKLARLAVVMALPPRSRVPLSGLWKCDGLPLPTTK